jgi:hypothetical protein
LNYSDWAYLTFLSIVITASYFPIRHFLHYFFKDTKPPVLKKSWIVSCGIIFIFSLAVYFISYSVPDEELGNRTIHAFGGGFLAFMVSFLAVKDDRLRIDPIKFFFLTFMLVMTLGIINEVAEYFLQNYFDFTAAPHINDTWLDLMSNFGGALIAGLCFTPFLNKK